MREIREVFADLRVSFTLVPWRMRPKLIGILTGSLAIAAFDLVAVVLTLPLMQVISGMTTSETVYVTGDVDGDGKVGMAEVIYTIQIYTNCSLRNAIVYQGKK